MKNIFNPPDPGLTLRNDVFPVLGLTVTEAATQLDGSRVALSRVFTGRAAISPEMGMRIEAWLGVARSSEAGQRFKAVPLHVQAGPMNNHRH